MASIKHLRTLSFRKLREMEKDLSERLREIPRTIKNDSMIDNLRERRLNIKKARKLNMQGVIKRRRRIKFQKSLK